MGKNSRKRKQRHQERDKEQHKEQHVLDKHGVIPAPELPAKFKRLHLQIVADMLNEFDKCGRAVAPLWVTRLWHEHHDNVALTRQKVARPACEAGCNHCCYTPVLVIAPEAVMIALAIAKKFSQEQRVELDRRLQVRKEALSDGDPYRSYLCPLNIDGKCGIYNVRPANCRSFHSFDANACREIFREGKIETLRPIDGERAQFDAVILESANVAYTALKMDTRGLEFISALEAALQAGNDVAERFASGEDIFAGVPTMESRTPSSSPA